jgi:hypothetical protein
VGSVLATIVPLALLTTAIPINAVIVVVLLESDRGLGPVFGYLAGYVVATGGICAIVAFTVSAADTSSGAPASDAKIAFDLFLGLVLLFAAVRQWLKRPEPGTVVAEPRWLERLRNVNVVWSFLFGVFWINVAFAVGAGLDVAHGGLATWQEAVAVVVYVLCATFVQLALVGYRLLAPTRATATLDQVYAWSIQHNSLVLAGIFAIAGVFFLVQGVAALA